MTFRLYLITDRTLVPDLPAAVDRALSGIPRGEAAVQLREKDLGGRALLDLAREVGAACRRRGAPLLVNDRVDVAIVAGADGVHLAGSSVPVGEARALLGSRLVGASCHDRAELDRAAGADFATFGPIFPSRGKPRGIGLEALGAHRGGLPLFALGGIDAGNAAAAIGAGARGVAAIRAWLEGDPAESAARLFDAVASRIG
ncbi:MAG TPA: thiamine phosphate synthase [Vulgatibacter sp.]|nr:thiamine phosphate synthase [Vulgatibacter sp.]